MRCFSTVFPLTSKIPSLHQSREIENLCNRLCPQRLLSCTSRLRFQFFLKMDGLRDWCRDRTSGVGSPKNVGPDVSPSGIRWLKLLSKHRSHFWMCCVGFDGMLAWNGFRARSGRWSEPIPTAETERPEYVSDFLPFFSRPGCYESAQTETQRTELTQDKHMDVIKHNAGGLGKALLVTDQFVQTWLCLHGFL